MLCSVQSERRNRFRKLWTVQLEQRNRFRKLWTVQLEQRNRFRKLWTVQLEQRNRFRKLWTVQLERRNRFRKLWTVQLERRKASGGSASFTLNEGYAPGAEFLSVSDSSHWFLLQRSDQFRQFQAHRKQVRISAIARFAIEGFLQLIQ